MCLRAWAGGENLANAADSWPASRGALQRQAPKSIPFYALVPLTPELSCSRAIIISASERSESAHFLDVGCQLQRNVSWRGRDPPLRFGATKGKTTTRPGPHVLLLPAAFNVVASKPAEQLDIATVRAMTCDPEHDPGLAVLEEYPNGYTVEGWPAQRYAVIGVQAKRARHAAEARRFPPQAVHVPYFRGGNEQNPPRRIRRAGRRSPGGAAPEGEVPTADKRYGITARWVLRHRSVAGDHPAEGQEEYQTWQWLPPSLNVVDQLTPELSCNAIHKRRAKRATIAALSAAAQR